MTEFYPPADRAAQWLEDNFPGDRTDANVGCLHTTETVQWPGYDGGATAPNLTARPNFAERGLDWRQHFRVNTSSRALRNLAGGVETNTLNVCQVELVGTCNPKHRQSWDGQGKLLAGRNYIYWPDAPSWALDDLAYFMRWCRDEHKIPLLAAKTWMPYPSSYGPSLARMTNAAWLGFYGWCGHQHVPENAHGDPGDIDITYLLRKAAAQEDDMPTAEEVVQTLMTWPINSPVTGQPRAFLHYAKDAELAKRDAAVARALAEASAKAAHPLSQADVDRIADEVQQRFAAGIDLDVTVNPTPGA